MDTMMYLSIFFLLVTILGHLLFQETRVPHPALLQLDTELWEQVSEHSVGSEPEPATDEFWWAESSHGLERRETGVTG